MKIDNENVTYKDYFILLLWFSEVLGLFCLSLGPFIVSVILALEFTYLFLLLLLVYLPLLPLLFILWSKFCHQED